MAQTQTLPETDFICYEQPLNERIRTFLRLEHLFAQTCHYREDPSVWGRRAAIGVLLDILAILSRHDLRTETAKELSVQHAALARLRNHAGVDHDRLQEVLEKLEQYGHEIQRMPAHFASYMVRDNELLNAINNRNVIPGGTCGFDLPGYQHWLHRPHEVQEEHFHRWWRTLDPLRAAIGLIVVLLRDSAQPQEHTASSGMLVHQTETGTQLLRVLVPQQEQVYPEISAGRHRSTFRFMEQTGTNLHVTQSTRDIHFRMAACKL
ncbi:MAG: cell division protein ZapD [Salinisphaera sp.]|nr:cell division protein ZapD [Salinisphaera sp.]MDN5940121.1 cell division protein ZapD [Salinisphaera sp.]